MLIIVVCHYGAGVMATKETLQMTKMAIEATRTCSLFGQEVILNGLTKTEYNGMKGTLGGYDTNTNRRIIYPIAGSVVENELALTALVPFGILGSTRPLYFCAPKISLNTLYTVLWPSIP